MMQVRQVVNVIKRELRVNLFSRSFLLATFIPLLILAVIAGLIPLAGSMQKKANQVRTDPYEIGVIGASPMLLDAVKEHAAQYTLANGMPMFDFTSLTVLGVPQERLIQLAREKVLENNLAAFFVLQGDISRDGKCDFHAPRNFRLDLPRKISWALTLTARELRMQNAGLEPDEVKAMMRGITWNAYEVLADRAKGDGKKSKANFMKMFIPSIVA
ncbi:hypothetical protein GF373_06290, partial [bacterium]|nr:hypothetical protein [bacterium]